MNERKLVKKLNRRSRGALDQAISSFTPYVSTVILRALAGRACREDVEELCADVFVALWIHADELNPEQGLRSWLAAVARNKATDWLRSHRPSAPIPENAPDPSPEPEELAQRRDQSQRLWAAVELILPEYNVLSVFFNRGKNAPGAEELVNANPISVSDDNYTMTVTTSMADGNTIYFTLLIEAKTARAMANLSDEGLASYDGLTPLTMKVVQTLGGAAIGGATYDYGTYDAATRTRRMNIEATVKEGDAARVSVRFNDMEEDLWLTFPVEPIHTVTLEINAEGQGMSSWLDDDGDGSVTLERVKLSPLSFQVKYTSAASGRYPVVYFLWKDGSVTTMRQMGVDGPGSGSSINGGPYEMIASHNFNSIQDISQMEAVVFEGMAYPLDGGEPYEVDLSGYPLPFSIPIEPMEEAPNFSFPLFALCDGLGASCRWDERAGTVAVSFRGVTATFTLGSKTVLLEGAWRDSGDMSTVPVYRDGDLWVSDGLYLDLSGAWKIGLRPSPPDEGTYLEREWTSLTVIP